MHRDPDTNMCIYAYVRDILLIPQAPNAPPHVGFMGYGEALGGEVLEEHRVHPPQSQNIFPHRNLACEQKGTQNGRYHWKIGKRKLEQICNLEYEASTSS